MKKTPYWIAAALGLLGPAFYLVTYTMRFNRPEGQQYRESIDTFLPVALGGLFLVWLLNRAASRKVRRLTWAGFLLLLPFGLFGSTIGGMLGIIGVILFGAIPLVVGAALGYGLGNLLSRDAPG
ncbi:MAG: hypothetical protein HYZ26_08970 [Chloroflexi bacterium]|nr:hypothetical protein [Chloroflexota bacterium]